MLCYKCGKDIPVAGSTCPYCWAPHFDSDIDFSLAGCFQTLVGGVIFLGLVMGFGRLLMWLVGN
jgi:hypothetical protein